MTFFKQFAERFPYPDNYTTIDLETDGISPENDTICTFGYTKVRNRIPVKTEEWILNWPGFDQIDQLLFQEKLIRTQAAMERQNKAFHHTYDFLKQGEPPATVLQRIFDLIGECVDQNEMLVGHNGYRFDIEFLQAHFHNWLRLAFLIGDNAVYDTGIAEKACQLSPQDNPQPGPDESLRAWSYRIGGLPRRGVKWALDGRCEEQYGLLEKCGQTAHNHHRSGFDSLMIHYVKESHRALSYA